MKKFVGSCVLPRLLASAAGWRRPSPHAPKWESGMKEVLDRNAGAPPDLYPGVRRAGVLLCPIGRPPCASVKVHIVGGGFQSVRLGAVVDCGRVGDDLLQVRVVVAVGMLQVHSVCIVVPPTRLLCIIHGLQLKRQVGCDELIFTGIWTTFTQALYSVSGGVYNI